MTRRMVILAAVAVLWAGGARAEPPDADAVMDALSTVLREMQDLTADVEVHTPRRQASGNVVLQYVRQRPTTVEAPEEVIRKYIVVTRIRLADGLAEIKQLCDGTYLWTERRLTRTGAVKVVRRKVSPEGPVPGGFGPDWRREIDLWRTKYDFRTLRTDTFDEEPVVVIEGVRKEHGEDPDAKQHPGLSLPDRMILFISSRDSFPRKVRMYSSRVDPDTQQRRESLVVSVRLMHVKLNEGLKPDTFHYTVPPGAEFIDVD